MSQSVLLYDGECRYCRNWADRLRRMDKAGAITVLPAAERDSLPGVPFIEPGALEQAVHLVLPDGRVETGSAAILAILGRLPRWRWAAAVFRLPGAAWLADKAYRWVAARRHRLS